MRKVQPIVANNGFSSAQNVVGNVGPAEGMAPCWMQTQPGAVNYPSVDANQLTSLNAMISYVAHHSGVAEFRVERELADRFQVPSTKCLPAAAFDLVLRYLVESISN